MLNIIYKKQNGYETFVVPCPGCGRSNVIAQRQNGVWKAWPECPICERKNTNQDYKLIENRELRTIYHLT